MSKRGRRSGQIVKRWTTEEDSRLKNLLVLRTPAADIAKELNRTIAAIEQRASKTHELTTGTYQREGEEFTFEECGCSGVLLKEPNKFAVHYTYPNRGKGPTRRPMSSDRWRCRVTNILACSRSHAKQYGSKPIVCKDHQEIRKLMTNPNCIECHEALDWTFCRGTTPHLDHDHETGRVIGFAHPGCNRNKKERGELSMVLELRQLGWTLIPPAGRRESGIPLH